jgi:Spy/CpxP family protein refolding chaperone
MRTRISIYALSCCLLAAAAVHAHEAQMPAGSAPKQANAQPPRPPSGWWRSEAYRLELKLTPEQSAEIQRIFQASMARIKEPKEAFERAQGDLRRLMKRSTATEADLVHAAERQEMARFLISKERTTMAVRIHSVLTPEQRKGLDAIAKRASGEQGRR